jgi:hypothetical protein
MEEGDWVDVVADAEDDWALVDLPCPLSWEHIEREKHLPHPHQQDQQLLFGESSLRFSSHEFVLLDNVASPFLCLSTDVLQHLCVCFLSGLDCARLVSTCSHLRDKLVLRRQIWLHLLKRDFPFVLNGSEVLRPKAKEVKTGWFVRANRTALLDKETTPLRLYGLAHTFCRKNETRFRKGVII